MPWLSQKTRKPAFKGKHSSCVFVKPKNRVSDNKGTSLVTSNKELLILVSPMI